MGFTFFSLGISPEESLILAPFASKGFYDRQEVVGGPSDQPAWSREVSRASSNSNMCARFLLAVSNSLLSRPEVLPLGKHKRRAPWSVNPTVYSPPPFQK